MRHTHVKRLDQVTYYSKLSINLYFQWLLRGSLTRRKISRATLSSCRVHSDQKKKTAPLFFLVLIGRPLEVRGQSKSFPWEFVFHLDQCDSDIWPPVFPAMLHILATLERTQNKLKCWKVTTFLYFMIIISRIHNQLSKKNRLPSPNNMKYARATYFGV